MPLESATYISDLDPSNPVGSVDLVSSLDDHMRLVKATLQTTFPGITGAVTATHVELNHLDGVTGTTGTGRLVLDDAPTIADLTVTDSITLPAASVADAALSDNVARRDAANTFTSRQTIITSSQFIMDMHNTSAPANCGRWSVRIQGSDGALEVRAVNDDNQTLGIPIDLAHDDSGTTYLSLTAPILDFNGDADISGALTVGGTITGDGSGLSLLNASNLSSGTVPGARLGGNQTMAGNKTFSGDVTIVGAARAGTAATSTSSTLAAGQIHHRSANTTVPSMNAGQWVAVQNTSTSSITLSQGFGVTLELAGTTTTGNRTLAAKGFAFIYFRANGVGVCGGAGVS